MGEDAETAVQEVRRSWSTLAGASLGLGTGAMSTLFYTQSLFFGPLNQAFGWTRQQLSAITLIGGFDVALAAITVGWLVDRFGVRGPALVGYGVVTAGFIGLGAIQNTLPLFIAIQLLIIAFSGATGPANYTRAVNQSFRRARGLALGLALAGPGLSALIVPPLLARMIQTHGWRAGYQTLALITAVSAPIVLTLFSMGRRPAPAAASIQAPLPLMQPLRDPLFQRLLASLFLMAAGVGGLNVHVTPLLTDAGFSLMHAAGVQSLLGLSILGGRLVMGWLVDRVFAPWMAAAAMVLAAVGLFVLAMFGAGLAPVAVILGGLALGAEGDVIGYLTARYFGMTSYGRLYGMLFGAYTVGLGIGAFLMASLYQASGAYAGALWVGGGLLLAGAVLMAGAPRFSPEGPSP